MSNEALTWAFRQMAPSTGAKFVLVALADGANPEHRCFPGQAKLMAMTGQGARSVVRHLAELESVGLVIRERRNEGYQKRLPDGFRLPVGVVVSVPRPQDANLAGVNLTDVTTAPDESQDATVAYVNTAPSNTRRQNDTGQNGRIKEPKELTTTTSTTSEIVPIRQDVERLCARLADAIEANGSNRPRITDKWRDSARLLIDKDGRTEEQVAKAIDWCQSDDFWRANILSMPTLREKYDRLRLAAARGQPGNRQQDTDQLFEDAARRMGVIS